eukprot:9296819-Pyramimonas_sp.AAC.1
MLEGAAAALHDAPACRRLPKWAIHLLLVVPMYAASWWFCQDTGLLWFDATDHYVQVATRARRGVDVIGSQFCKVGQYAGWKKIL